MANAIVTCKAINGGNCMGRFLLLRDVCNHAAVEGNLNRCMFWMTTKTFIWYSPSLNGLAGHMMANENFHCRIKICLHEEDGL